MRVEGKNDGPIGEEEPGGFIEARAARRDLAVEQVFARVGGMALRSGRGVLADPRMRFAWTKRKVNCRESGRK
jgi:hypothetical protein